LRLLPSQRRTAARACREGEALAQRVDVGRDDAEVLGDDRQRPEAGAIASNSAAPGPAASGRAIAVGSAAGISQ
jgi:hypothetical protein